MKTYFRYFHCLPGTPLHAKLKAVVAERNAALKAITKFMRETGLTIYGNERVTVSGVMVPDPVPPNVWTRPDKRGLRRPNSKHEAGREMAARLKALPNMPRLCQPLLDLGFDDLFAGEAVNGRFPCYGPEVYGAMNQDDSYYIKLPWADEPAADLKKYKKDNAAGRSYNSRFDHLLTPIPAELVEVKKWQMLKAFDEHNALIKQPKKKRA